MCNRAHGVCSFSLGIFGAIGHAPYRVLAYLYHPAPTTQAILNEGLGFRFPTPHTPLARGVYLPAVVYLWRYVYGFRGAARLNILKEEVATGGS